MSVPVPDQAILGPLIYAPPWARMQAPARDLLEDRVEPVATEPASLDDAQEPELTQPSASFEDDFAVMALEECLALAPDQVDEAAEEITDFEPRRWPGNAWPVAARLACTLLLALAGAMGFRWLSGPSSEPREGRAELAIHESLAHEPAVPATVASREPHRRRHFGRLI
jgi:hypothetical protein